MMNRMSILVLATPMDEHGYMRISLGNMVDRHYMDKVDKIILEINPTLPVVNGDTEIHIRDVDRVVEVNTPLRTIPLSKIEKEDEAIGKYVASLVNDGDTIQLGIGSIPDAIALALADKKDLGIHTEMINSGMAVLIQNGVVTNKKKTLHRGKTVGTFAFGDQNLYDCLDNNPTILMLPAEYVNNPAVIAQNDNMVAINTAIQVDLTGQVGSEGIGSRHYSGSGGRTGYVSGCKSCEKWTFYHCFAFYSKEWYYFNNSALFDTRHCGDPVQKLCGLYCNRIWHCSIERKKRKRKSGKFDRDCTS